MITEGGDIVPKQKHIDMLNLSSRDVEKLKEAKANDKFTRNQIIILFSTIILALLATFVVVYTYSTFILFVVIFIISVIVIYPILSSRAKKHKHYVLTVKEIIIKKMFEKDFDHVIYNPEQGFDEQFINSTQLFAKGNTYASNDLLSATYKGVGFIQADVHIQEITSNGKTTTVQEIFEGRWLVFDFYKQFNGTHQVRKNFKYMKNRKPYTFFGQKLKSITFEDSAFNDIYKVYSSDNHEAFYLMTPRLMQNMIDYQHLTDGEIVFGFINNKLHIAINDDSNAFEVSDKTISDEFINRIEKEMEVIKYIIDQLNLDNDLYI